MHNDGLKGIAECKNNDHIYIFYSKSDDKVPIELVKRLNDSKAIIEYIKSENGTKNALDFQLSSYFNG